MYFIIKMSQGAIIGGVAVMAICCSVSSAAYVMMGGDEEKTTSTTGPAGPPCERDKTFTTQTGAVSCSSVNDFKPEGATWWGSYIGSAMSDEEATAAGISHTFHTLSSSPTEKKYIAMHKTPQHCKMIQFDITKSGNTCSYKINDAGYTGMDGSGASGTPCTATTDAEVIAQWNAKTLVPTARTAVTDEGYGLKSIKYSMYC
jgi:hypothetical protein